MRRAGVGQYPNPPWVLKKFSNRSQTHLLKLNLFSLGTRWAGYPKRPTSLLSLDIIMTIYLNLYNKTRRCILSICCFLASFSIFMVVFAFLSPASTSLSTLDFNSIISLIFIKTFQAF